MADDLNDEYWISSDKRQRDSDSDSADSDAEVDKQSTKKTKKSTKKQKTEDSTESTTPSKRKKQENGTAKLTKVKRKKTSESDDIEEEEEKPTKKKEKKVKKQKPKKSESDDEDVDSDLGDSESDASDDAVSNEFKKKKSNRRKISDMLAKTVATAPESSDLIKALDKHFADKLSTVEADELSLSDAHFAPRRAHDMSDTSAEYLQTIFPRWNKKVKALGDAKGTPLLLVVTSAASRAVDVIRDLKKFHYGKCKVAKLFAKHMKLKEQTKFLGKNPIQIGVGTPSRISVLLDNDVLKLDQTALILFDWSWRNVKLRRLIDIPDVKNELCPLLKKHLVPKVKSGKCKFALL